ncbi:MAG: hypothetical protein ABI882_02075, partial [Acidobacteriota bacterium]
MRRRSASILLLSAAILLIVCAGLSTSGVALEESNWPQWRGPAGLGVSPDKGLPTEWSATKNIKWSTPIPGRGHSSPIIWGRRVFLTTSIEGPLIEGAQAVKHVRNGQAFIHPDSVGAEFQYTLKVLCLD